MHAKAIPLQLPYCSIMLKVLANLQLFDMVARLGRSLAVCT